MNSIYFSLAKITLKTEFSPWFIPLFLLLGLGYAALLYSKNSPWTKQVNLLLACTRFLLISILSFLIIGPLFNQVTFEEEPPVVVLAIDDSQSAKAGLENIDSAQLITTIKELGNFLEASGIEVRLKGLSEYIDDAEDITFNKPTTDLNGVLNEVSQDFEQQNLSATILISDGIHNFGSSPQFFTSTKPVYTLGIGDTIPAQDLSLKRVNANKVVYQGKRFPLVVDIYNNGFVNEDLTVEVISGGEVIARQNTKATGDQQINSLEFILEAGEVSIKSYQVRLDTKEGESTFSNNSRRLFVEVIDSEQKILIAAASPHPDIKTLRTVIESKEGTEVSLWIENITQEFPEGPFDLVIFHQLPGFNDLPRQIDHWIDDSNTLFMTGTQELDNLNRRNQVLSYSNFGQTDNVSANFSPQFDLFEIDENLLIRLNEYPPITVPYGTFQVKEGASIMLFQRIGAAQTNRPLLTILNDDERKSAVFSGTGIWKWRLQESALYSEPELFDELFGKLIQFLSTTENKTNFNVTPVDESYTDSESVEFVTEVYNELYEKVYDYNISFKLRNENNEVEEYNYVNTPNNEFNIQGLESGVYTYEATVRLNNRSELSRGSFTIEKLALEDIDLTANHQLLRNIANNNGGQFFKYEQWDDLTEAIKALNPKPITRSSEELNPLIDNPLWLFLLVGLMAFEWFTRKYHGHY